MTRYDAKISVPLRKSAKQKGFDPNSKFVPSAAGMPLRSTVGPKEFNRQSRVVIRNARYGAKRHAS